LNAATDQAAEDARRELEEQQNKTILSHAYLSGSTMPDLSALGGDHPLNGIGQTQEPQSIDIFADNQAQSMPSLPTDINLPMPPPTIPDFTTLPPPPLPDFNTPTITPDAGGFAPQAPTNDPGQFRIPGQ
jgi:hypothetical protein